MTRQRVRLRRPAWSFLTRLLTVIFGLALAYGGVLLILLAVKTSPTTVNRISLYRTIYHDASGLRAGDFTTAVSLIAGFGGLLVFLFFAFLTLQAMPRPYLARSQVDLPRSKRGATVVRPRAVERAAEFAARENRDVTEVSGRLGDRELFVDIAVARALEAPETLGDVRRRVRESLATHKLPSLPVHVTLTGYDRPTRRESS